MIYKQHTKLHIFTTFGVKYTLCSKIWFVSLKFPTKTGQTGFSCCHLIDRAGKIGEEVLFLD